MTRRDFGVVLCGLPLAAAADFEEFESMPWNGPATLARAYLASPAVHWPKPTLDVAKEIAEVDKRLLEVAARYPHLVQLTGGEVIRTGADANAWLAKSGEADGALIVPITQPAPGVAELLGGLNVPALMFSRPYASHTWAAVADYQKRGRKVDIAATSDYTALVPYFRAFRTAHHMRHSKVLVGTAQAERRQPTTEAFTKHFGTAFRFVGGPELKAAFEAADAGAAAKEADRFVRGALKVVEPSKKEIHDGLRFYLALRHMLKQEKANAFTIDCFGTLAANTLPGYPCIAWSKFNDAGLYGVCEADLASTMTQILVTSYTGMPGFVTDPVFDLSRNEVIHAHCVSATKMKGIRGPASPYIIRNHLETNEGAVLQVMMPAGGTVTVARFTSPTRLLISTAESLGAVDSDRGCRTQVRTRVSDAGKWLRNYTAGLHRVLFYGDHVRSIERMGRLLGFEVVHEI